MVEHNHSIHDLHQDAHNVFNPNDGYTHLRADMFQHLTSLLHFFLIQSTETFVSQ